MNVKIINPFLAATTNMLKQMFSLDASPGAPYIMDNMIGHRWEISGLIAITGDTRGVVAIRLHHVLVDKLLEKSGVQVTNEDERSEVINGLVGELINIVSGNAIGEINGYSLDISVPMIVQGDNHSIAWPKIAPVVCIPFRTKAGDFEVAVCFKE
jgi:chemotaxis protein CheX